MTASTSMPATHTFDEDHYAFGSKGYAWLVCLLLSGLQIVSNMERQIINLVVEPLRRDFHIQDVQVSVLQGIAFALFYAVVAVPIGWLADRWRRDRIIIAGMALWALCTLGCMIARSFEMLFVARLLIGLADASLVPASMSLLGDYFPRARLAGPVGILTGATFLGSGMALTFGGLLLAILPVDRDVALPLFGSIHGWQLAFGIMCLIGIAFTLALLAIREPVRRDRSAVAGTANHSASFRDVIAFLIRQRRSLGSLLTGLILLGTYQYGFSAWAVTMFIRVHGWSATRIGFIYGLYLMILGPTASALGGRICDWLRARGRADANYLVPLGGVIALLPLTVTFSLAHSGTTAAVLLGFVSFASIICFGPAMAAIPDTVPSTMRAQTVAITMLLSTLVGGGGGPWLIAMFTQNIFANTAAIGWSMAVCAGLLLLPTAIFFYSGARTARRQET
ncbi:MFS transporter [Novosphingobium sp. 9]|uniref:MFS transporter n=1 Tax=Novosphingobium sp. 9 TaxID=2025349 RepID=UPI0021B50DBE|nr:MFS transporter [Novosphingobium sp. 9]